MLKFKEISLLKRAVHANVYQNPMISGVFNLRKPQLIRKPPPPCFVTEKNKGGAFLYYIWNPLENQ